MTRDVPARIWFGLTALVAFTALVLQVILTSGEATGKFPDLGPRLFNLFCYFTIDSNVIVAVTTLLLAVRLDRTSTLFRVARLTGLIAIVVTGVVYHLLLAGLFDLHGADAVANQLLHTVSPIMCTLGWLVFGPRGMITPRIVVLVFVFPLLWAALTLIRGPIVDYYPYPFVDVDELGYPRVLLNMLLVGLVAVLLAAGAAALDKVLPGVGRRHESEGARGVVAG